MDIWIGGLLSDLLLGRLSSLLIAAQQIHVGLPRCCFFGCGVSNTAIGASDDVVLALKSALERRKWLVSLGEVEVSLDEELQFSEAVHTMLLTKNKQEIGRMDY